MMKLKTIDLDTRNEYLIIYKDYSDDTINTWTLGMSFVFNYKQMMRDSNVKILAVYRKMQDDELKQVVNEEDWNDERKDNLIELLKQATTSLEADLKYYKEQNNMLWNRLRKYEGGNESDQTETPCKSRRCYGTSAQTRHKD